MKREYNVLNRLKYPVVRAGTVFQPGENTVILSDPKAREASACVALQVRQVRQAVESREPAKDASVATGAARELAAEHGIDLSDVQSSGTKITKPDVQAHIDALPTEGW